MKKRLLSLLLVLVMLVGLFPTGVLATEAETEEPEDPAPVEDVVDLAPEPEPEPEPAEEEPAHDPAPVEDEPAAPAEDEPAAPAEDKPAAPAEDEPAAPAEDEPAAPAEDEPAAPAEDEPAAPAEDEPAAPAEDEPAAPVEDEPAAPAENEPAAPAENEPLRGEPTVLDSGVSNLPQYDMTWQITSDGVLTISGTGKWGNNGWQFSPYANQITTVVVSSGYTQVAERAFYGMSTIRTVFLPLTVKNIDMHAFAKMTGLETVEYEGSPDDWADVFQASGNEVLRTEGLIHCAEPALVESVTLDRQEATVFLNDTVTLTADVQMAEGAPVRPVTWSSSNSDVARVDDNGTVTGMAVGTAVITARSGVQRAQCTVTVEYRTLGSGSIGAEGTDVNWVLLENNELIISGSGAMTDASPEESLFGSQLLNIKTVTVRSGVTSLGAYAFRGCTTLTSVRLPAGLASVGAHAFDGCTALGQFTAPSGLVSVGDEAFRGCTSLPAYLDLGDSLESLGAGVLYGCTKVKALRLPAALTYIDAGALDGSSVTDIYFEGTSEQWAALGYAAPAGVSVDIDDGSAVPAYNRLATLVFVENTSTSDLSTRDFRMEPAFDPAVRDYTLYIPDYATNAYCQVTPAATATADVSQIKIVYQSNKAGAEPTTNIFGSSHIGISSGGALTGGSAELIWNGEVAYTFSVVRFATPNDYAGNPALRLTIDGQPVTYTPDYYRRTRTYEACIPRTDTITVQTYTDADRYEIVTVTANGVRRGSDYTAAAPLTWSEDHTAVLELVYSGDGAADNVITVTLYEIPTLTVSQVPDKTVYAFGELFDPAGMEITATYADGSSVVLTQEDYSWSPAEALFPKDTSVTVFYRGASVQQTVTVTNGTVPEELRVIRNLTAWSMNAQNSGAQYVMEPAFDPAVMAYTVHVRDNSPYFNLRGDILDSSASVTMEYVKYRQTSVSSVVFNPESMLLNAFPELGHNSDRPVGNTVTIKVNGKTAYILNCVPFNTLYSGELTDLAAGKKIVNIDYIYRGGMYYEAFLGRSSALRAKLTSRNSSTTLRLAGQPVSSGVNYDLTPQWDADRVWDFTIEVEDRQQADTGIYNIHIMEPAASLTIVKGPDMTKYAEGSAFDPSGMELTASYADGTQRAVDPTEITFTPELLDKNTTGVTVTFRGASAVQPVTVDSALQGSGTEEDPYLIATPEDYELIRTLVAAGHTYRDEFLRQTADIELPANWQPIGVMDKNGTIRSFMGTLDGAKPEDEGGCYTVTVPWNGRPLFGTIDSSMTVRNLNIYGERINGAGLIDSMITMGSGRIAIENVTLRSGSATSKSGLVGGGGGRSAYVIFFRNCTVESNVTVGYNGDQSNIGSLIGSLCGTVENCVSYANVYGVNNVGGLVGYKAQSMSAFFVKNSQFRAPGSVTATGRNAGGIVGGGYYAPSAPNTALVIITNCVCDGAISGVRAVGGILGAEPGVDQPFANAQGYITGNTFAGTVSGQVQVGAIVGYYRTMNRYVHIENNYYAAGCGAARGIGFVTHIDTSGVPFGLHDGTFYYNTGEWASYTPAQRAEANAAIDADWYPDAPYASDWNNGSGERWKGMSISNLNSNRTDDPLGADAADMADEGIPDVIITDMTVTGEYRTEYMVGEAALDTEGIVITVTYNNGESEEIDLSEVEFDGFDSTERGKNTITVIYKRVSTTFDIWFKAVEREITVKLSVLGDTRHGMAAGDPGHGLWLGGLTEWLPETEYTMSVNESVFDLITRAAAGDSTLTVHSYYTEAYESEYIDWVQKGSVKLEQKDNHANSGWMVAINGKHVQVGVSKMFLNDGDKVILHWCDNYVLDEAEATQQENDKDAAIAVEYLIDEIGQAKTLAQREAAIKAARAAYDALTEAQKALVDEITLEVLLAAEENGPQPRIVLVPKAKSGMEIIALDKYGEETDDPAKIVSYVVYLDASRAANSAYSFDLDYRYIDIQGRESVFMQKTLTYATTDKKVAAVKANADDTATVTIPAKGSGAATVTATAKSLDLEAGIAIYVREYSPRIESTTITLNPAKNDGVSVRMTAGYGNAITGVTLESDVLDAVYVDSFLTVTAKPGTSIKNTTFKKVPLKIATEKGEFTFDLKIVVKNAAPALTVTQTKKYNTFYAAEADRAAVFAVTSPAGGLTVVKAEGKTYSGEWTGGELIVTRTGTAKKVDKKLVITYTVEGYTGEFTKTVNVAAAMAQPDIRIDRTKATVNTAYGSASLTVKLLGRDLDDGEVVTPSMGEYDASTHAVTVTDIAKSGTLTITVTNAKWAEGQKLTFKVKITANGKLPAAKAAAGTLPLNAAYPDQSAFTWLTLNTADVALSDESAELTPTDKKAAAKAEAGKLIVVFNGKYIIANFRDREDLPKAGTYSFSFTPKLTDGTALKAVTVKVKVANSAVVTATVTAAGKLDAVQRDSTAIVYTLTKIDSVMGEVTDVNVIGTDASLFDVEFSGYNAKGQPQVKLTLKEDAAVSTKAKYKIALEFELDGEIRAVTKTQTVKVTQSKLKYAVTPKSTTLFQGEDTLTAPAEYTLTLTSPAGARIERVELSAKTPLAFWKSLGTNAQIRWTPQSDGTVKVEIAVKDPSKVVNGKSYKVLLDVYTAGCATNVKPVTVTVTAVIRK